MTSTFYHQPVLLHESVDFLVTNPNGIYIDATLGGGGHSSEILSKLDLEGELIGVDQDSEALSHAKEVIGHDVRFSTLKGNFGHLDVLLPKSKMGKVSGILLDLGVSSHQIDAPERGFTFREEGPLDMRMNADVNLTAERVVNEYPESELVRIFFQYGEERWSRKIAAEIVSRRPLSTTKDLSEAISAMVKGPHQNKSLARIFQAIRIEVNQELDVLEKVLSASVSLLAENGRLVVISYHSLEDRIVKNFMRSGNFEGKLEKDFYGNVLRPFKEVSKGIITASSTEISENPRARSAKMRIAERTAHVH